MEGGGGVLSELPSVVGVWIFSGITHFRLSSISLCLLGVQIKIPREKQKHLIKGKLWLSSVCNVWDLCVLVVYKGLCCVCKKMCCMLRSKVDF